MNLNSFMSKKIDSLDKEDLCEDVFNHAQEASDFGVESEKEHALYFFICNNIDELIDDTFGIKLKPDELKDLGRFIFNYKSDTNYDLTNLVDLRILSYKWLSGRQINKTAYPNMGGVYIRSDKPSIDRWMETAKSIYSQINAGMTREAAFDTHTSSWDRDEVFKFNNWLRYYEQKTPEKYNVKTANIIKLAFGEGITIPAEWENPNNRTQMQPFQHANDGKTKREIEIERAKSFKSKMKSRLRALKMLLDKYNDLLPNQSLDKIYEEMLALEKSVGKLNAYAALEDRVMCSAAKMQKLGFTAGSMLLKEAVEGRADETNLPPGLLKTNVEAVLTKLEGIGKELKMRNLVREMSKCDIMLAELGLGSYFPELGESIARMLEGFSYAGNRIEDSISKLRGSGKSSTVQAPEPKLPEPKLPKAPDAQITPPLAMPSLKPAEKLEPSALHEQPISKVKTELPTPPTPKPGV